MGKGSRPRPCDKKKYDKNYDRIFRKVDDGKEEKKKGNIEND